MPTIQESNKARMRKFVQVVQNDQDVDAIHRFFASDFKNPDLREMLATDQDSENDYSYSNDVEGDKVLHEILFRAFPDIKVTILDIAADGDKVWTYKLFEGTHSGPWLDIPPTGKKVSFHVIDIMTFRDSMIIDHKQISEFVSTLASLRKVSD
ncbi:SnoaL-like polyketide cyclase [Poriferisphaera corsica]|uniref:SnoaL-like polyketide cyclase n=1 Tax=Poriferisphaera corsica TaxID=2528020 RepID=A0A517YPP8_9BACT|nr:ester cyclase [Poriferisphaera corsica]QDU32203.1 SnoaL-like polyketide cyclase [Poriferisphaera corsica]